jgi:2-oxoglutarate/2-oxoacid ferredoxin oxidoreductase subunit alpha
MEEIHILNDISIVLAGEAGQGIQSIESILTTLAKKSGYHVFATKEYMSRVRGGINSTSIRISSQPVSSLVDRIDILIPLSKEGIPHLKKRIDKKTLIIADATALSIKASIDIPFAKIALEIGNAIFANTIAAGVIAGILSIDEQQTQTFITNLFERKGADIRDKNTTAVKIGYALGKDIAPQFNFASSKKENANIMLSGADAISLGALAGGCDYVCGYPMSPSTSVLERLAKYSLTHDIIAEQVEDEVGVINMALGAWYAGARALVTTSGGGFALMCEGISLSGIIETPVVVHLAQRPGPATGLPTRTEQGDLSLVLYAGHGDFPRIILAPGTLEEGFSLMRKAFDLADRFQIPVFVLTDQYFVDSYYDTKPFKTSAIKIEKHIVETDTEYKRYAYSASGISPRGIPGFGKGIVCVDSDEHSEGGYIIEDAETRIKMTDKRLKKNKSIIKKTIKPQFIGKKTAKTIIITWGSTFNTARDAIASIGKDSIALMHFSWIFPLPDVTEYFKNAKNIIAVENNVTGQFADLLVKETGIKISKRILKYNGRPFTVEELADKITKII